MAGRVLLHPVQREFLDSKATFRGYVGGRGSGKSWIGAYDMLTRAMAAPGRLFMVSSPTYTMLRDASARSFVELADRFGAVAHRNQFQVTLASGSQVLLRSADEPERMRGPNLSGVWLDEASVMVHDAYLIAIACLREGGELGWMSATFTPKGKQHWTYSVFGPDPQTAKARPNTALFHSSTRDNPFLPAEFEGTIKGEYSPALAEQELGGHFIDPAGAVFKKGWLRHYTTQGDYYRLGERTLHRGTFLRFATVDLACSVKESADYTVIATWDALKDGTLVLVDVDRRRLEAPDIERAIVAGWHRWRWQFAAVEANGMQLAVVQYARRKGVPVRAVTPHKDKLTRSVTAQVRAEAGQLWLPASAPWLAEYEAELLSFTGDERQDAHDDQVDCTSCAAAVADAMYRQSAAARPRPFGGMEPV